MRPRQGQWTRQRALHPSSFHCCHLQDLFHVLVVSVLIVLCVLQCAPRGDLLYQRNSVERELSIKGWLASPLSTLSLQFSQSATVCLVSVRALNCVECPKELMKPKHRLWSKKKRFFKEREEIGQIFCFQCYEMNADALENWKKRSWLCRQSISEQLIRVTNGTSVLHTRREDIFSSQPHVRGCASSKHSLPGPNSETCIRQSPVNQQAGSPI